MQTYQIEIDPAALVHDGVQYEPVAFRGPKKGEQFIDQSQLFTASSDYHPNNNRLIVRPVWQWPEWLGGAAIAMNSDGKIHWYSDAPSVQGDGSFFVARGWLLFVTHVETLLPSFTPPPLKPGEIVWSPKYKRNNESE